jgi:membrane protein YqaA with SNARE-associated domain
MPPDSDAEHRPETARRWLWFAFIWGAAEAVFFFIVPDVLTSRLVLRSGRLGALSCVAALAGALLGGALLYLVTLRPEWREGYLRAVDRIPGVNAGIIERAGADLAADGGWAFFAGAANGIPYKLYAAQAGAAGMGFFWFMAATLAARLGRFALVTGAAWAINRGLAGRLGLRPRLWLHAAAWMLFYGFYFRHMGL